jgi:hypothetical protein
MVRTDGPDGRLHDYPIEYTFGEALRIEAARLLAAVPDDRLATFHRDAGRPQEALAYARRLQQLMPDDPSVDQLVRQLGAP